MWSQEQSHRHFKSGLQAQMNQTTVEVSADVRHESLNPSETSEKGMVLKEEEVINKRKVLEDAQRSSSLETSQDLTQLH